MDSIFRVFLCSITYVKKLILCEKGDYSIKKLGLNLNNDENPQQIVKAGSWFGAIQLSKVTIFL